MRYYVYELVIMPDDKVCYVGKGSGSRMHQHLKRAQRPETKCGQKNLYRHLREILADGKSILPRIVYQTNNELDALRKEAELIHAIGFDTLFNLASHAFLGRQLKAQVKASIAAASKRMWRDPAYRAKNKTNFGKRYAYRPKLKLRKPKNRISGCGFKGVSLWTCLGKTQRWMARITVASTLIRLGYFKTSSEAATAYDDRAEKVFGIRPNST